MIHAGQSSGGGGIDIVALIVSITIVVLILCIALPITVICLTVALCCTCCKYRKHKRATQSALKDPEKEVGTPQARSLLQNLPLPPIPTDDSTTIQTNEAYGVSTSAGLSPHIQTQANQAYISNKLTVDKRGQQGKIPANLPPLPPIPDDREDEKMMQDNIAYGVNSDTTDLDLAMEANEAYSSKASADGEQDGRSLVIHSPMSSAEPTAEGSRANEGLDLDREVLQTEANVAYVSKPSDDGEVKDHDDEGIVSAQSGPGPENPYLVLVPQSNENSAIDESQSKSIEGTDYYNYYDYI